MLAVARRLLRHEEDARDAVQDAFISAFKALGAFEGGSRLSTWLHRIIVNASLMKIRASGRRPEKPIEDLLPKFLEDGHAREPDAPWEPILEVLQREELKESVRNAIDELPDSYRTVLVLRDLEGLSTEETANALELTPNAAKIRLHRARQALKTLLDGRLQREEA